MKKALKESFTKFFTHFWKDFKNQYASQSLFKSRKNAHKLNRIEQENILSSWENRKDFFALEKETLWTINWLLTIKENKIDSRNLSNLLLILSANDKVNKKFLKGLVEHIKSKHSLQIGILINADFVNQELLLYDEFVEKFTTLVVSKILKFYELSRLSLLEDIQAIIFLRYDKSFFHHTLCAALSLVHNEEAWDPFYLPVSEKELFALKELGQSDEKENKLLEKIFELFEKNDKTFEKRVISLGLIFAIIQKTLHVVQLERTSQKLSDLNSIEYVDFLFDLLNLVNGTSTISSSNFPAKADDIEEGYCGGRRNVAVILRILKRRT